MSLVFFPFENQFIRDVDAYIHQCGVNKENGSKGGRPKTEKTESVISKPKKADKDKDTDNEKEKDSESEKENEPTHSHFLNFDFYKTDYTQLPIELQTTIQSNVWQSWQVFNQHIDKECKRIRQIPEQINFEDYLVIPASNLSSPDLYFSPYISISNPNSIW